MGPLDTPHSAALKSWHTTDRWAPAHCHNHPSTTIGMNTHLRAAHQSTASLKVDRQRSRHSRELNCKTALALAREFRRIRSFYLNIFSLFYVDPFCTKLSWQPLCYDWLTALVRGRYDNNNNHKNYNFLACDWFKNVLFSTNSLAKLLSDSLLLDSLLLDSLLSDSLISQSHSKMQFKSTNHIQSCNYVCVRARCCFCVFALDLGDVYASYVSILMRIFPFFHNFAIFLFLGNCNFYD